MGTLLMAKGARTPGTWRNTINLECRNQPGVRVDDGETEDEFFDDFGAPRLDDRAAIATTAVRHPRRLPLRKRRALADKDDGLSSSKRGSLSAWTRVVIAALALASQSSEARAEGTARPSQGAEGAPPTFFPRFTVVEAQYPQGVAASIGSWVLLPSRWEHRMGGVADLELGLSGASLVIGAGATSSPTAPYERASSLGVQGVLHRTWPWWSPWLPTAATFGGAEVFAHLFAFRCSAGVLWPLTAGAGSSPLVIGGCGLGTP